MRRRSSTGSAHQQTLLIYKATCRRGTVASVANLQRDILLIKDKLNRLNKAIESRCQKYESLNNWSIITTFWNSIMNEELKLVFKYCITNKQSFNPAKANYMVISSSWLHGSIHIHNIEHKSQIKYLGVYMGQNLHRGPQIQHKCS